MKQSAGKGIEMIVMKNIKTDSVTTRYGRIGLYLQRRILQFLFCVIVCCVLAGCVSPLKSDDPSVRAQAIAKITDDKELMLIAMNVGVKIGRRCGSYTDVSFVRESYFDDVRIAAVDRIQDVAFLLKCATWQDGDYFVDPGAEDGRVNYRGDVHYVQGDLSSLSCPISTGDRIRKCARNRLKNSNEFRRVCQLLYDLNRAEQDIYSHGVKGLTTLFPTSLKARSRGTSFINEYGDMRRNNPLDVVLTEMVENQSRQEDLCLFVSSVGLNKRDAYPNAIEKAIDKIDGSVQELVVRLVEEMISRMLKSRANISVLNVWKLYDKIQMPSDELSVQIAKLGYDSCSEDNGKRLIDEIAKRKFTSRIWARCYLEDLFNGYPKEKKLNNITDESVLADVLVCAKQMGVNEIDCAMSRIDDVELLKKIKKEGHLKLVSEKADAKHFMLSYEDYLSKIEQVSDKVRRGVAAMEFRKRFIKIEKIGADKREEVLGIVDLWMTIGADEVLKSSALLAADNFVLSGFYVGMEEYKARLLKEVKYPKEHIRWLASGNGIVERLDFGTTYLAKVYNFEASTWGSWIAAFGVRHGRQFVEDVLKDEKKPIGGRGTIVRVTQPIWRSQDNRKGLTFTYFGEKSIQEIKPEATGFVEGVLTLVRGVTGGDVVKELMVEGARHWADKEWENGIGAYPGTLRIELGTVGPGGTRIIKQPSRKSGLGRHLESVQDSFDAMKEAAPVVEGILNGLFN